MPAHPAFFTKALASKNGPDDEVPLHAGLIEMPDWEVEIGAIVGNSGKNMLENNRQHAKIATKDK